MAKPVGRPSTLHSGDRQSRRLISPVAPRNYSLRCGLTPGMFFGRRARLSRAPPARTLPREFYRGAPVRSNRRSRQPRLAGRILMRWVGNRKPFSRLVRLGAANPVAYNHLWVTVAPQPSMPRTFPDGKRQPPNHNWSSGSGVGAKLCTTHADSK